MVLSEVFCCDLFVGLSEKVSAAFENVLDEENEQKKKVIVIEL